MEEIAVIDMGTNTFHLVIVDLLKNDDFYVKEKFKEPVKLGEGGITTGIIAPAAFERGLNAMQKFKKIIDARKIDKVYAFATSAVRSAENQAEFIRLVKETSGIEVRVINGNEEAAFIYQGVKNGLQLPYDENVLLVDIGGGSVEFVVADAVVAKYIKSLKVGAAMMLEKINPSDPITEEEIERSFAFLDEELEDLITTLKTFKIKRIFGSSGSFETVGTLVAKKKHDSFASNNINGYTVSKAEFYEVFEEIISRNRTERLVMPGMETMRVDMIVLGILLIKYLFEKLEIEEIVVSSNALKEGIIHHHMSVSKIKKYNVHGHPDKSLRSKSIKNLCEKFGVDSEHTLKITELAHQLFDQLGELHDYGIWEREMLAYASQLVFIGKFIKRSGYHKHSLYIIQHSEMPGFTTDEQITLSNIVRYHRKALPTKDHFNFRVLSESKRLKVRKLASVLRIAVAANTTGRDILKGVKLNIKPEEIEMRILSSENALIEIELIEKEKQLMEEVFDKAVVITNEIVRN